MDLMELAKQFGPSVGIVLFFIYRDWKRESHLDQKLSESEQGRIDDLKSVVRENTRATNALIFALDARPCLVSLNLKDKTKQEG